MQGRFIATTCQVNEFFPRHCPISYLQNTENYTFKLLVVTVPHVMGYRKTLLFLNQQRLLEGAGYRYTRLWKANQSMTGGQWPWKFTWRSSSALLFWRCFCCASTCIFIFIYGCNSWSTHHFMRPWQTLRSSKSLFVRVFYGEKVEKEGRRELSIRDETSGDKLLKTLNKKKVVQTGIRMKDSSALRANSCNESYNETHVSEKRGNITKQCLPKRKNLIILILVQAEVDLRYLVLYWTTIRTSCTGLSPSISHYHTSNP